MCSGGSGCVATCCGFYLIVVFVEGSAPRCDWPSAPRAAPRTQRRKKRKEGKSYPCTFLLLAATRQTTAKEEEEEGGGGREDTNGSPGLFTSGKLQHSRTRRSSSGRTAASKPEKKEKECFCKTIQEKKKVKLSPKEK